jgi:hypothetical protein
VSDRFVDSFESGRASLRIRTIAVSAARVKKPSRRMVREVFVKTTSPKRLLVGYDDDGGKAELQFVDREGAYHSIWVEPRFLRAAP